MREAILDERRLDQVCRQLVSRPLPRPGRAMTVPHLMTNATKRPPTRCLTRALVLVSATLPSSCEGEAAAATSATGYRVEGREILDPCGEPFVMRGVNHPTIFVDRQGAAMEEIAETGANAVRIFWFATRDVPLAAAEDAVMAAVDNGMVPMIELHDSTCKWDLEPIVEYWTRPESVEFIRRHEAYLMVNIANEASAPSSEAFRDAYVEIVERMREAGIHTPLVIDGSRCGRDYEVLFEHGAELLDADPDHNLVFSAHLYDALDPDELTAVLEESIELDLPFIVGEFTHRSPPGCGNQIEYAHLISEAERLGIGWLAWSWGDDDPDSHWNSDCPQFDMTRTFSFESLEGWGKEVAVDHPASIANTAVRPRSLRTGSCDRPSKARWRFGRASR
jgi:mannan endo-1,4-beta-mannosidase